MIVYLHLPLNGYISFINKQYILRVVGTDQNRCKATLENFKIKGTNYLGLVIAKVAIRVEKVQSEVR